MSKSRSFGSIIATAGLVIAGAIYFSPPSCSSGENNSPVSTYEADLTVVQSGMMTTITLNSDGSAVMQDDGHEPEYTYWDYAGKGIDVRISDGRYGWYFIDFDQNMIYYGAQDYRSNHGGYALRRLK
jgi:hypothetical protein